MTVLLKSCALVNCYVVLGMAPIYGNLKMIKRIDNGAYQCKCRVPRQRDPAVATTAKAVDAGWLVEDGKGISNL